MNVSATSRNTDGGAGRRHGWGHFSGSSMTTTYDSLMDAARSELRENLHSLMPTCAKEHLEKLFLANANDYLRDQMFGGKGTPIDADLLEKIQKCRDDAWESTWRMYEADIVEKWENNRAI